MADRDGLLPPPLLDDVDGVTVVAVFVAAAVVVTVISLVDTSAEDRARDGSLPFLFAPPLLSFDDDPEAPVARDARRAVTGVRRNSRPMRLLLLDVDDGREDGAD